MLVANAPSQPTSAMTSDLLSNESYQVSSGRSYPLGANCDENGTNFAIFSANAKKVELCLFDENGEQEIARIALPEYTDDVWHGYVHGIKAGSKYGYRVHGAFEPHLGHRFNANKLLLDPYAKQLHGDFISSDTHLSYDKNSQQQDLTLDIRDNAAFMPKCVVVSHLATTSTHPQVRRRDTIIYELHVKGFSQLNQKIDEKLRGTFAGLSSQENIQYLQELGVTSVELLPVHQFINEDFVEQKGLSNYWGYNSIAFFVPHNAYSASGDIAEFKHMVAAFHHAGIEVILDVVFNHTAEGNELGPTYCFKGIDNASYYRLQSEDKRYYRNFSGCGNTININHPRVLQLITDSLRYWVDVMGVDGFRFDLAPILGRETPHFSPNNHFFTALRQDPTLAKIKLIAEPWDIGEGGYQLGRFPKSWLEWNDRFRDTCRRFWRGDKGMAPEFARRLHGSSDLFEKPSRRPSSSVNFITSHDGFTLTDLVSYKHQHNHANGEKNSDGHSSNYSENFGVEGPSDNVTVNKLRLRQKRNLLTTLFIAQGTPMLLAGDELGHSQQGNNNAYCQDNELTWLNWQTLENNAELLFVQQLIALRKAHPLLNRTHYQHGNTISDKTHLPDISWLNCRGVLMAENDWHNREIKCFAMLLADTQNGAPELNFKHKPKHDHEQHEHEDDALLIIFNAHQCEIDYQLPQLNGYWKTLINTADNEKQLSVNITTDTITIAAHSCAVLSYLHLTTQQDSIASADVTSNTVKSKNT